MLVCIISDAGSGENERCQLAPTNPENFQIEVVLESTNTTLESMSDLLESTSRR